METIYRNPVNLTVRQQAEVARLCRRYSREGLYTVGTVEIEPVYSDRTRSAVVAVFIYNYTEGASVWCEHAQVATIGVRGGVRNERRVY